MAHALRYLVACLVSWACLRAQTPPASAVRFSVFAAKPIEALAFAPKPGAPPQVIEFSPTARSARLEYRGAMPLRFVDAASGVVLAEAVLPPEIREALLLFSPMEAEASKGGLRYRVAVIDDSAVRHGPGGLVVLNLSGLSLAGTINEKPITLAAGLNPAVPIGRTAKVVLRATAKGRTFQSYAGTVQLGARERALLILFPPFYRTSLEVQSRLLLDQPPGADAPKKSGAVAPTKQK